MNKEIFTELQTFLWESAKGGYAANKPDQEVTEANGSHMVIYTSGEWSSQDNFFGGEPFAGRIAVSYQGKVIWVMVYYGRAKDTISNTSPIYDFLLRALANVPEAQPFRGPAKLEEGDYRYINNCTGTADRFSGEELIYRSGEKVYKARYAGGLVDQR